MTNQLYRLLFLLCFSSLVLLTGCSSNKEDQQVELTISAAASLAEALAEVKATFEKENPTIKINYSFGSSGSLQEQIIQGAPVDLFISAAEDKFVTLVEEDLIKKEDSSILLTNELVLISSKETEDLHSFQDLLNAERISIGIPESVPAGQYAKEVLEAEDLWNLIQEKIVFAKDVRQVLTYVETKNVDAGIVYHTDALLSENVKIVSVAEKKSHSPIVYPLGILSSSAHKLETRKFYEYLQSKGALMIFEKYGFSTVEGNS
ncbi:molybdate ABC transporter substrate-binding protein [Bacillus mesophilus]|uniref:Molybdate ABC transporter substrate-binding protein n=1 Tax=Bacillus mesophilus TaxID=1808955 RepID=A0A6M0QEV2_9BACI|nr:molybdate ABC transporter substrate-binding protein [Bacillus mesophilus]